MIKKCQMLKDKSTILKGAEFYCVWGDSRRCFNTKPQLTHEVNVFATLFPSSNNENKHREVTMVNIVPKMEENAHM